MTDLKNKWADDQRTKREARERQAKIDHDLATHGESFARIFVNANGEMQMEHVPREVLRPILIQHVTKQ